jgi:hypothetical protein
MFPVARITNITTACSNQFAYLSHRLLHLDVQLLSDGSHHAIVEGVEETGWKHVGDVHPNFVGINSRLERGEEGGIAGDADNLGRYQWVPDQVLRRVQCGAAQAHERTLIESGDCQKV